MTTQPLGPDDETGTHPCGDVVDPETGRPRLLNRKCDTCIFRPGNLMHLDPGQRDQMVRESLRRGSWILCHDTLAAMGRPVGEQALCRGFWDVHGRESLGCRLAVAFGGPVEVDPPASLTDPDVPVAWPDLGPRNDNLYH